MPRHRRTLVFGLFTALAIAAPAAGRQSANDRPTVSPEMARYQPVWPSIPLPDGMLPLPARSDATEYAAGSKAFVCLYNRARPREVVVLSQTCYSNWEACTVWVALPEWDAMSFMEFNADNPPVVTKGPEHCTRPYWGPEEREG